MSDIRIAGMFYEQRGPMVFSASLHLTLFVFAAIWAMAVPEKPPEELVFELVTPASESGDAEQPPMEALDYRSEEVALPTLDEIELPERPQLVVEPPPPAPEPAPQPQPQQRSPEPRPEPPPPRPAPKPAPTMTFEEFQRQQGPVTVTNVRKQPPPQQRRTDLSKELAALTRSLNDFSIESLPRAQIAASSAGDQQALASYLARFKEAIRRNLESHPSSGARLRATVRCDISGGGIVSNVSIVASSGDAGFDRKVLAAFSRVRSFDEPPANRGFRGISFEVLQD